MANTYLINEGVTQVPFTSSNTTLLQHQSNKNIVWISWGYGEATYTTNFNVTDYKTLVFRTNSAYANYEAYAHWTHFIVGNKTYTLSEGGVVNNITVEIDLKKEGITGNVNIGFLMGGNPASGVCSYCYVETPTIYLVSNTATLNLSKAAGIESVTGAGTHTIGSTVNIDATVLAGYKWSQWSGNTNYLNSAASTKSNSVTVPDATVSLTANATGNTYYIAYNTNASTYGKTDSQITGTMANSTHVYGTSKALTANAYSLTGYTFAGWNTKANGTGTSYINAASVNNLTTTAGGTITLYARWTPITYTIAFNANGGIGTTSSITATYDTSYNLTKNNFTREGYVFIGWSTSQNGNVIYTDQQSISNLRSSTGTITLYAVWVQQGIVHIYVDGIYKPALVYIYSSNDWKMAQPYSFNNNWKICIE